MIGNVSPAIVSPAPAPSNPMPAAGDEWGMIGVIGLETHIFKVTSVKNDKVQFKGGSIVKVEDMLRRTNLWRRLRSKASSI